MNEMQLRVMFNIIPDPEVNKLNVTDERVKGNIRNIINIIELNNKQKKSEKVRFRSIKALEKVLSYN